MTSDNVEAVTAAMAAFNRGGVDALLEHLDPGVEWVSVPGFLPDAQDRIGHDGVREWFATISELFDDLRWDPLEIIDSGDRIVIGARMSGTGKASGIPAGLDVFHVVTVRAGRASRLETYLHRAEAMAVAGLDS